MMKTRSDRRPRGIPARSISEQVKAAVSMRSIAERYGMKISRGGYIACPFHADKTPSLKLYDQPGRGFYCYGCGKGGSVIDFAMQLLDLDFRSATVRVAADFGIVADTSPVGRAEVLRIKQAMAVRAREEERYQLLQAKWLRLSSIRWALAPEEPDDEWDDQWCVALAELPALEEELHLMEVAGYGR